jgi:predicted nucleic acid-binding protein
MPMPRSATPRSWPDATASTSPIDGFDAQIAAICRTRGAALATRNTKDFRETGIDLIDPWQEGGQSQNG